MKTSTAVAVAAVAGLAALYVLNRATKSAGSTLSTVANTVGSWVNPVSDTNLAYTGVNAVGTALTGDKSFSLGSWIYDMTHDDPNANAPTPARPAANDFRQIDRIMERQQALVDAAYGAPSGWDATPGIY